MDKRKLSVSIIIVGVVVLGGVTFIQADTLGGLRLRSNPLKLAPARIPTTATRSINRVTLPKTNLGIAPAVRMQLRQIQRAPIAAKISTIRSVNSTLRSVNSLSRTTNGVRSVNTLRNNRVLLLRLPSAPRNDLLLRYGR